MRKKRNKYGHNITSTKNQSSLAFVVAMLIKHSNLCPDIITRDFLFSLDALSEAKLHNTERFKEIDIDELFELQKKSQRDP